jgi:glycine cleavage system aminomethyltransferase T/glycine/D-amino acid oxidase-like deaminating enzyme
MSPESSSGERTFPASCKTLIIGAGIVGNSLAYHLTRLGEREIVLIDKGPLPNPGGSTGHASNFIFPVDHSREMTELTLESMRQYRELGVFTECGGIELARTDARMQELARRMASAKAWGIEPVSMLTPEQVRELVPYLDARLILGGFYTPGAGVVDSLRAGTLMRERAQAQGLQVFAGTEVLGIDVAGGRVCGVQTSRGAIQVQRVVICAGAWSPRLARMAGAHIPLTPAVHQMIDIGPVPRFERSGSFIEYPIVRDMDTNMYERQDGTSLEIGSYAHRPITLDADEIPAIEESALSPTELPFTQEDFELQMETALELMPEIVGDESVGIKYAINGVLSVTYDGMPLLGETPEVRGLWCAAAIWIKEGPAAGKTVAELIVAGESEIDVYESNIARAHPCQKTRSHVLARAREGFNKMYGIVHPAEQWESDRGLRRSPFYERERELSAVFHETAGWERPHWYESNAPLLGEFGERVGQREAEWEARWWSPIINAEHLAMRERAGLVDLSAFTIFDISGPGALAVVQRVAMRQLDVPVGRVVYTPVLTPSATFKADLTIMRIAEDRFRVVTGGAYGESDRKWFADRLPDDGSAQLQDLSSSLCTLGLWGPDAAAIMRGACGAELSAQALPFARFREIEIGSLPVLASRISYVGEFGWELYVAFEHGARLWEELMRAGEAHGLVPVGIGVYGTTGRLEKCYRAYGAELDATFNVVEAGMAWGKVKDEPFIGRDAHLRHREQEPDAVLCAMTVEDHTSRAGVKRHMLGREPLLTPAGEPIVDRRGRRSYVTSAGSGPSLGSYILMGYLPPELAQVGQELAVEYLGESYPVTVARNDSTPLFDPENARVRGLAPAAEPAVAA